MVDLKAVRLVDSMAVQWVAWKAVRSAEHLVAWKAGSLADHLVDWKAVQ